MKVRVTLDLAVSPERWRSANEEPITTEEILAEFTPEQLLAADVAGWIEQVMDETVMVDNGVVIVSLVRGEPT